MLDASCGDLTWMSLVSGIEHVRYTGADISERAVEDNRIKFGIHGSAMGGDKNGGQADADGVSAGGGVRDPVFVRADLVEGVPASQDGNPYDLIFVR